MLRNIIVQHDNVDLTLDFHIFDGLDFEALIGHALENLLMDPLEIGELDIKLGRNKFTIPFTRAKNSVCKPPPHQPLEVMSLVPFETPESSLEKDEGNFMTKEDDSGHSFDLPTKEALT